MSGTTLVTVPNVELLEVGENWETMTGVFSFTQQDLVDAIQSQDDPAVRTPVVKLGHVDPRFDGQPAFGRVINLRLTNNGQTLVGDIAGLPGWLTTPDDNGNIALSSAFPRRSIEGAFDYSTQTGNKWGFVLTGLALLGDAYPAINTLEDIAAAYGDTPPRLIPVEDVEELAASDGSALFRARKMEDTMPNWLRRNQESTEVAAAGPVKAAQSVDDIRRAYYDSLDAGQMWWWVREVRVDPLELIVDDDQGGLYQVPVSVTGDTVSFGEPTKVKVEYVAAAQPGQLVAATYRRPDRPAASEAGYSDDKHSTHDADDHQEDNHGGDMPKLTKEALAALGLPEDADEDAINAAILQLNPQGSDDGEGGDDEIPEDLDDQGAGADVPNEPAAAPEGEQPATQAQVPSGMVLIDEATLTELREGAVAAGQLMKDREKERRDALLDSAVKAGKFPKARRGHYEKLMAADPSGTAKLIEELAPGVVPVEETGLADVSETQETAAYPDSWGRSVAAAHRGVGSRVKVVAD